MMKQGMCIAVLCLGVAPVHAHKVEGTTHVHEDVIQQQLATNQSLDADAPALAGAARTLSVHQHTVLPQAREHDTTVKNCELPSASGTKQLAQQNVGRNKAC